MLLIKAWYHLCYGKDFTLPPDIYICCAIADKWLGGTDGCKVYICILGGNKPEQEPGGVGESQIVLDTGPPGLDEPWPRRNPHKHRKNIQNSTHRVNC